MLELDPSEVPNVVTVSELEQLSRIIKSTPGIESLSTHQPLTVGAPDSRPATGIRLPQGTAGPWGQSSFELLLLGRADPEISALIDRMIGRLEQATGLIWSHAQSDSHLTVNIYEAGDFVHPHKDVTFPDWPPVECVATVLIESDFDGGEFFVNREFELNAIGDSVRSIDPHSGVLRVKRRSHRTLAVAEDCRSRKYFDLRPGSALVFDNNYQVHGTLPVIRGRRVTCSLRCQGLKIRTQPQLPRALTAQPYAVVGSIFTIGVSKLSDGDYDILESPDAYARFWSQLNQENTVPKFVVQSCLAPPNGARFVDGFLLMPNAWHGAEPRIGRGDPLGDKEARWIAWAIPFALRPVVQAALRGEYEEVAKLATEVTCLSLDLAQVGAYEFDATGSDVLANDIPRTVHDLRPKHEPSLRALSTAAKDQLSTEHGVSPDDVEIYAHYPVRPELAVLHVHACVGHSEQGALADRSHGLDSLADTLETVGKVAPRRYQLRDGLDPSLDVIIRNSGATRTELNWIRQVVGKPASEWLANTHAQQGALDAVVPCAGKDREVLPHCLSSLRACCPSIRRMVVVSPERYLKSIDGHPVEHVHDHLFGVNSSQCGSKWRFQQILKLLASFVIPNLTTNVLVVDADTIWHRPNIDFLDDRGRCLYSRSRDERDIIGYKEWFDRGIAPLGISRRKRLSAITHHMVMNRTVLAHMFVDIRRTHGSIFDLFSSGKPSEWELYFHYARTKFPETVAIRDLVFEVTGSLEQARVRKPGVDFAVCHSHRRRGIVDRHDDGKYYDED